MKTLPITQDWLTASRGRVLVVDDDPDLLHISLLVLSEAGFSVQGASSGAECLKALRVDLPDLILLDINLDDLSGLELCRRIKSNPDTAHVAIVHLSGDCISSEEQATGLEFGAEGYIARPISSRELIARVEATLRVKRTETELQRLTEKLQSTSRALQRIMDNSLDVICTINAQGQFIEVSVAAEKTWGFSRGELIDRRYMELVHPGDRTKTEAAAAAIMAGQATSDFENRYCRRDGSVVHMMWSAIWSAKEETMFCVARDITARKEAEELIHKQAALLDCAQEAIFVQDIQGTVLFWNKSAAQIYGYPAEEMIGRPFNLAAGSSREQHAEAWRTVLEEGDWSGEFTEQARNGREFMVEGHWTLVRDFAGAPESVLCINADITERKKLEAQFLRAQRMESIGTLAGGIAHDLNNVLSPIVMSIDLLKLNKSDASTLDVLETIEMNARRGADMVRQVLSFARGVEGQRLLVQPKYLLKDVLKIASDTFPRNIELEIAIPPDLWNVLGDATQLHQVLLNLCVNARDAMPGGGRITIAAANVVLDEHYVAMHAEAQVGPHVILQVQDNGTGMTAEIQEKIFDPFFTTKEIGKGTGLGLSTSLAIVKSHGGFIRVYTEVGRGSSFKVHLPAENGRSAHVQEAAPASLPRGNGELIMVIDDEFSIRAITQQTLDAFGYRCLMAADGAEAVALYAKHRAEVAVVVTDMMMPMMDGQATIQILRKLNPKLPIIAASGLTASAQVAKVTSLEVKHFLAKPYTAETLLTALKEILSDEA